MISVVIPTFGHRDFVLATLESVLAQTYRGEVETIVVNDGSPDDTRDVLRPLIGAGRIRYFEQPNRGQASARNAGLAAARGGYVAFLDDDDVWPPDKLQWQAEVLDAQPSCVLVYGDYARIEPPEGHLSDPVETYCPQGRVELDFRRGCWILSPGQTLMRASALRRIGGFDGALWGTDDWDLYLRLAAEGDFVHHRRVALHYRVHEGSASRNAVRHVENYYKWTRKHEGFWPRQFLARQRESAPYFVKNLLSHAHDARGRGDFESAAKAHAYALTFRPSLVLRGSFVRGFMGSLLRRPPRQRQPA